MMKRKGKGHAVKVSMMQGQQAERRLEGSAVIDGTSEATLFGGLRNNDG
jgi:hypothetical protein